MSKLCKTLTTMFLCISILILSTSFPSLSAYAKTSTHNIAKIDSELFKKLQKMDNDDTINVSVWLNDIDKDELRKKQNSNFKALIFQHLLSI